MRSRVPTLLAWLNSVVLFAILAQTVMRVRASYGTLSSAESQPAEFQSAMRRARDPSPSAVSRNLIPLRPGNAGLVWDRNADDPEARVLVAAWSGYSGYATHRADACAVGREVWVTPIPQLQQTCRGFGLKGERLEERLTQYLGLQPSAGSTRAVVELWVRPKDLFRPCPDPEISDVQCELRLPQLSAPPTDSEIAHARWFAREFQEKYYTDPYPWTRLGYTYDWGSSGTHEGASEYVIRARSIVWVASVTATEHYCTQAPIERAPPSDAGLAQADDC